jgi:hypothetical protein
MGQAPDPALEECTVRMRESQAVRALMVEESVMKRVTWICVLLLVLCVIPVTGLATDSYDQHSTSETGSIQSPGLPPSIGGDQILSVNGSDNGDPDDIIDGNKSTPSRPGTSGVTGIDDDDRILIDVYLLMQSCWAWLF